ncbi:hypothetical protein KUTeg_022973 [Tegillarca granosa]|uniref:Flavin-containing monooxygenase n=1 Tax=Tegillarca granosa TaxID=220873 RepID=A0ABQ9E0B4_TEGGR|nr:hypothetical protein KUTeg_022973 [Tegillarca granosa]
MTFRTCEKGNLNELVRLEYRSFNSKLLTTLTTEDKISSAGRLLVMTSLKRVAVIGAGVSGIVACKELLQQGFDVTCFEMHDEIGGLWYFTKELRKDEGATIYEGLITNSDREMMRYSDFNFSPTTPPFLPHQEYYQYIKSYADHFDVTKRVQLNSKILSINKAEKLLNKWKMGF